MPELSGLREAINKKRTDTWLSRNQLHLPLGIDQYGPIGSIALVSRDSQSNFSADSKTQEIPEWKKKLQSFDTQASYGSSLMERAQKLAAKTEVNGRGTDGESSLLHATNAESKGQRFTDRLLYTEALMRKAQREGNIYAERILKAQIEKAQRNSRAAGIDASTPMPTIYADHIKAREAELQRLIKEAEEVLSEESVSAAREESISADARDKLGEITARGTTKIKQGFTAFSKDDVLFERAKLVRPDGNKFDVAMHGTSQSVAFGGEEENMSPRLLAAIIKHNKDYNGQEIRLLSCNTGKRVNDDYCFAEELANALGVTVYAPNDLIIFNDDGTFRIGEFGEGSFVPYKPNERRRLK